MHRPPGWTEEDCSDVHAFTGADESKQPVVITAWRPTPAELVKINLGEPIYLTIYGMGMPPVALSTDNPWRTPDHEE